MIRVETREASVIELDGERPYVLVLEDGEGLTTEINLSYDELWEVRRVLALVIDEHPNENGEWR
jgi:hypothetical protein